MTFLQKLLFEVRRHLLFAARPLLGNRRYTKRYTEILARYGVDIKPFGTCGFIATSVSFDKYGFERMHIGRDVFLTHDVILLVHDQSPVTAYNSTVGGGSLNEGTFYSPADIWIGDNVFIGMRSIVMPGSHIGDDVVIGAGSLVKGSIPSGEVWAGVPARRICSIAEYREKLARRGAFEDLGVDRRTT